ncbi:carbohydrate-binding module family 43 protein/Glycoside hydrolase family 72 protein [Butyriboletus roseoflavus]|nr:carbohydrate-binding module family 43 protein/Glycoside hydrolase family 72 protein [Butyriboletus roseoflavus]
MRPRIAASLIFTGAILSGVQAIQTVTRAGRYLYTADGNRFYIKGVAYQEQGQVVADPNNPFLEPSTYIDPLSNGTTCQRDLPYLQQLGINTIRAYGVNSALNHDTCMGLFSNAGIYTIIDLSLPVNGSIDRAAPAWTTALQDQYIETIQAFSKYDNVLAYNVGNEVVIAANGTAAATFVKTAARDIKSYLNSIKSSALVGYAAIDGDSSWILPLAEYLSCDPSSTNSGATAIDLYGLNNYQWCGNSTFQASYAGTEALYSAYNVPAYFSEYGCPTNPPTDWSEVGALLSSDMSPVWSGGVAFSYFPAASAQGSYGIVSISADGSTVTVNQNFDNLKTQYTQASPPNSPSKSAAGSTSYPACPQQNSTMLASTTLPPTPDLAACTCLENNLSCQFTPTTSNYSAIVGSLLNYGCSMLGQAGSSCNPIAANGTTGVYGAVSACDPTVMLSWVLTQWYLDNGSNAQACSFGGNGTVNTHAPSSTSAVNAAASSCLASATGTSVPTLPAGSTGSSSGGSSTSTPHTNGAAALDGTVFGSVLMLVVIGVASGLWTLA